MLAVRIGQVGVADVRRDGRHHEPLGADLVLDGDVERERIPGLRVHDGAHDDPRPFVDAWLPRLPPQEAVDRVVLLGLGERHLLRGAVPRVPAVGEPIGPRDQGRAVRAVAHLVERERVEHVVRTDVVDADGAANLDDRRMVVARVDLELGS